MAKPGTYMVAVKARWALGVQVEVLDERYVVCRHPAPAGEGKAVREWIEEQLGFVGLRVERWVREPNDDRVCAVIGVD